MIRYPSRTISTIGVTAPSSGVPDRLHHLVRQSEKTMKEAGVTTVIGDTVWTQQSGASDTAEMRAAELMRMMKDPSIDAILPPWGGELLMETLEHLSFQQMEPKWVQGYSDISLLLFAITLQTGIATAHGTNFIDLRGAEKDDVTAAWLDVLKTQEGESVTQHSSARYQKEWPSGGSSVYQLTEPTRWETLSGEDVTLEGRILSGCVDVLMHLAGTPFGDVAAFQEARLRGEPLVWVLETAELSPFALRRALLQLRLAGWFDHCSGIIFGRSSAPDEAGGLSVRDVYERLAAETGLPVVFNADTGHVPPQMTFINGSRAFIEVKDGRGIVTQTFAR